MREKIFRLNLFIGIIILLFSAVCLALQVTFMKKWFFTFAWWSFILAVDSLNYRKNKSSPLSESFRNFLFMAFISVFVWLVFELFNLRLKNWSYHNLPPNLLERWLGYFIAFATVIPALQETSLFFAGRLKRRLSLFRIQATPALLRTFIVLGVLSVVLALSWPRIFFPFTWLCFIFLLEPVNFRRKNETLLRDVERKDWRRFWSWVLAGLVCGFFWEFWNFWAESRWEYNLPCLNFWRVFQMPVLGYTGFLPFALEIFAIHQFLFALYKELEKKILLRGMFFAFLILFYVACFYLIDRFTLIR